MSVHREPKATGRRRGVRLAPWVLLALVAAAVAPPQVAATIENDISPENTVSEGLPSRASLAREGEEEGERKGLHFAVVPQVGYGPDSGPKAGIKFEGRDMFGGNTFADVNLLFALKGQQKATLTLGNPRLGDFMLYSTLSWYRDPAQEFFGTGNNDVGSFELSNHDLRRARAGITLGYRILRRVAFVVSGFLRETDVKPGEDDVTPSTTRFAPDLPGIGGARSNYLSAAIVFNSREEVVRPTQGWELIFKYLSANHALWNDDAD